MVVTKEFIECLRRLKRALESLHYDYNPENPAGIRFSDRSLDKRDAVFKTLLKQRGIEFIVEKGGVRKALEDPIEKLRTVIEKYKSGDEIGQSDVECLNAGFVTKIYKVLIINEVVAVSPEEIKCGAQEAVRNHRAYTAEAISAINNIAKFMSFAARYKRAKEMVLREIISRESAPTR